jgi:ATP-dependent Clp protease ATP-binding subunit ClpC
VDQVVIVRPGSSADSSQRDVSYWHWDGPDEDEKGGADMFERFTDRARQVVVLAQEEARMLNHNYIGTEHILLGLIREGEGVAARALESLGISLDAVRQQVEEIIGRGQQAPSEHIPFTPRAKKVLELAWRESQQLSHNYIGTEHILLGLIREGDGVAAQVLVGLGADLNRVRQQVIQLLHGSQGTDVPGVGSRRGKRARARLLDDALARIDSLDRRLAAIEGQVGLRPDLEDLDQEIAQARREKEAAIDRQDFEAAAALRDKETQLLGARTAREKEWMEAAAGRLPLAGELGRVTAELDRLRAVLREHGIDPGDDAA